MPLSAFVLPDDEVEAALREGRHVSLLERYFGTDEYRSLKALAAEDRGLRRRGRPRVLIVPGLMGSKLGIRRKPWDNVIWFDPFDLATGRLRQLAVNGGDAKIRALGVFLIVYLRLKLRLQRSGYDASYHAYDWRQSIRQAGADLAQRIAREKGKEVLLVAHSLGGLVARAALKNPGMSKVKRLVMLGTPNHGSYAAVTALRGTHKSVQALGLLDAWHSLDELVGGVFSTFPGLYEMLPDSARSGGMDLHDPANWPASDPKPRPALLEASADTQESLAEPDDRMVLIAGSGRRTICGARVKGSEFEYTYTSAGDGTVPLDLAMATGLNTFFTTSGHTMMPHDGRVYRAVEQLLETGTTDALLAEPPGVRAIEDRVAESELRQAVAARDRSELSEAALRDFLPGFVGPGPVMELAPAAGEPTAAAEAVAPEGMAIDGLTVERSAQRQVEIRLARGSITEADDRAIVLGVFQNVTPRGAATHVDDRLGNAIERVMRRRMFSGHIGSIFVLPTARKAIKAEVVVLAGLGPFDRYDMGVCELVAENIVRTLVDSRIDEFATVAFGGASGHDLGTTVRHLAAGFVRGLCDADRERRFRTITLVENDPERYDQLRKELYSVVGTGLFRDVRVTFREETLPQLVVPGPLRAPPVAPRPAPVYLLLREHHPGTRARPAVWQASVLSAGGKATVVTDAAEFGTADLKELLAKVEADDFTFPRVDRFGEALAKLVLPERVRDALGAAKIDGRHLAIVHDAPTSRVPWETVNVDDWSPAAANGVSRRYVADDLSVAKWLEERRRAKDIRILLIVNPTQDLGGAEAEGERIKELLAGNPSVDIDELAGAQATRAAVISRLSSGDYDLVHYAGHAGFDPRDPARLGLLCHGREMVTGDDLSALTKLPSLVFLNACESARVRGRSTRRSAARALERAVGVAEALLRGGIASFVGTYWPVGDAPAKAFAETFYDNLTTGATVGEAVLAGRTAVRDIKSPDWADYIHYGDHEFIVKLGAALEASGA